MTTPHLIRTLSLRVPPLRGEDVEAVRRGAIRFLDDGAAWTAYTKMPTLVRRTYGPGMRSLVKRVQTKAGIRADGVAGPAVDRVLRNTKRGYDAECYRLLSVYAAKQNPYCYPHPLGAAHTYIGQGPHATAGLPGNIAIDFMAPGNTYVLAVIDCEIVKISGHPPTYVLDSRTGIFGWNIHYESSGGYRWFSTHYGQLGCRVGQRLVKGQPVGKVGWWPHDPGRSHTHLGVTSPKGRTDATAVIERVAHSPRIPVDL